MDRFFIRDVVVPDAMVIYRYFIPQHDLILFLIQVRKYFEVYKKLCKFDELSPQSTLSDKLRCGYSYSLTLVSEPFSCDTDYFPNVLCMRWNEIQTAVRARFL